MNQLQLRRARAFTLVELLVSMAVLSVIVMALLSAISMMATIWQSSGSKVEQFRAGRRAFESITRRIATATLAPYLDYEYPGNNPALPPTRYVRKSELRFLSSPASQIGGSMPAPIPANSHAIFFQAPLGFVDDRLNYGDMEHLLNTWGYFVDYTPATNPGGTSVNYRYRLYEMREPSENLSVYRFTQGNSAYVGREWITIPAGVAANRRVLADNVIALILLPKLSASDDPTGTLLAPGYIYDSTAMSGTASINPKNQLPPLIEVIMVVLDELSAARVCVGPTAPNLVPATLFTTASSLSGDLAQLELSLVNQNIKYQTFRTTLSLPGARWSSQQAN